MIKHFADPTTDPATAAWEAAYKARTGEDPPRVLTAHIPMPCHTCGDPGCVAATDGLDLLVTIWPDGSAEVANRPGTDARWVTWSAPIRLEDAS